uniref:Predicted protein n=1 Tax=Hordeum vulgare subsp. vulgare TaxID=112509 RepID=F2DUD0_HORVV|nr:predicted protein [Hordeum vulgare subsp. vulgare]
MASRTSIIRGNFVHFGEDSIMEDNPKKEPLTNTLRDNQLPRTALRKRTIIRSQAETRTSDTPPDDVFKNLVKMNAVHLPATIRKICSETTRVVTGLLNSPLACNSSVMRELKCLMSSTPSHDSYLLSKALIFRVKERLNELNAQQQYNFGYDAVAALVRRV